jgi:hypothetical protein
MGVGICMLKDVLKPNCKIRYFLSRLAMCFIKFLDVFFDCFVFVKMVLKLFFYCIVFFPIIIYDIFDNFVCFIGQFSL